MRFVILADLNKKFDWLSIGGGLGHGLPQEAQVEVAIVDSDDFHRGCEGGLEVETFPGAFPVID
jgi:hypothetical protein